MVNYVGDNCHVLLVKENKVIQLAWTLRRPLCINLRWTCVNGIILYPIYEELEPNSAVLRSKYNPKI